MAFAIAAAIGLSAYSSYQNSQAIGEAADVQSAAALAGVEETGRQYDQTREDFAPFREAGIGALSQQQAMLGLSGAEAQEQAFTSLQESPAQQFLRGRAERSLMRNNAALGGLGGGNIRTALIQQGVGFGQQDIDNQFNRLGVLTGGGQAATTNVAQFGAQAVQQQGAYRQQGAAAQASGILGQQQQQSQFTNMIGRGFMGAGIANQTPGVSWQQGAASAILS